MIDPEHFEKLRDCFYLFTQDGAKRFRPDEFGDMTTRVRLINILKERTIYGHSKGYFHSKGELISKSVSFSRSRLEDLDLLIERNSEYGLCFPLSFLAAKGIRKVLYYPKDFIEALDWSNEDKPFIDLSDDRYRFEWEREYRLLADSFKFELNDLDCIIIPMKDKRNFRRHGIHVISAETARNWANELYKSILPVEPEDGSIIYEEVEPKDEDDILTPQGELVDDGIADELIVREGETRVDKQLEKLIENQDQEEQEDLVTE